MERMTVESGKLHSVAEDLFVEIFCDVFGPEQSQYLYIQYPFNDIYGNHRYIDFALESGEMRIAIEIDGETYHNPKRVSSNKYYDDLLKQNSLIYQNWKVYRWAYLQLKHRPEQVKDQLRTFFDDIPTFRIVDDYLPKQKGKTIELKDHQQAALQNLQTMRDNGESIALLYHATGTGKTVTAVSDAQKVGKRTLFLAHTKELVTQAKNTFDSLWEDAETGLYVAEHKEQDAYIVCGSIQSVAQNIEQFHPEEFGYLIIDECHHAAADTYKKVLSYFKTDFTLGLTATPDRMDGENLLETFQNVAHKLDLKTAVEIGELVPIRCIRIKTNIDLSSVRINGIKYQSQDLESKLFIPERNNTIVTTYVNFVKNKKTVVFCASVKHAEQVAVLMQQAGINAAVVSGTTKKDERTRILEQYEYGEIDVLCACDLLNEGWDSPRTEVLFMARPTLSKTLYIQQLGRGMRKAKGKQYLTVFDFIDNASLFNTPYSVHRLFNVKDYRPGKYVLAPEHLIQLDKDMLARGEKPTVYLDFPIDVMDYELVDLFNWQDEVKHMISQLEFVRMVDVQAETIENRIRSGDLVPDLKVPYGDKRFFNYFKEATVLDYAKANNWELITAANMYEKFIDMVKTMDMSYSYKPVLLKAMFAHMGDDGKVAVEDIVDYFIHFYTARRQKGIPVEKKSSVYSRDDYTKKEVEHNIFANPFKRFADMRFMKRSKDLEYVELNRHIFKKLTPDDRRWIAEYSDQKLEEYYNRRIFRQ